MEIGLTAQDPSVVSRATDSGTTEIFLPPQGTRLSASIEFSERLSKSSRPGARIHVRGSFGIWKCSIQVGEER